MCDLFRRNMSLKYAKPGRAPPDPALFPNYFQNAQHMWCHFAEWWPLGSRPSECRGAVFIVSGLGEHCGRYDSVARFLNQQGFVVFSQDNQGAGGSEGLRTYVNDFNDFVNDVLTFVDYILNARYLEEMKEVVRGDTHRLFLLGHSMGGLIAALAAQQRPNAFGGVILSGPAFRTPLEPGAFLRKVVSILNRCVPKLAVDHVDKTLHLCSGNPPVYELLVQDPVYAHESLRAHFVYEFFAAQRRAFGQMERTTFPLLILHGESDGLCSVEGSRRFFEEAVSADKRMCTYPGAFHEILTERWRENVLRDVMAFVDHIASQEGERGAPAAELTEGLGVRS